MTSRAEYPLAFAKVKFQRLTMGLQILQGRQMSIDKIDNVDNITNTGAIRRFVIVAIDRNMMLSAKCSIYYYGNKMGFRLVIFTDFCIASSKFKVPETLFS